MVSPEHGGSSSSPSDSRLTVDSVGGAVGGHRVVLDDGSSFFVSEAIWRERPYEPGERLDHDELSELHARSYRSTLEAARAKAVAFLARREHTALQLRRKLFKREFPEHVINDLVSELLDRRLLSEERYAEEWLRVRMRRNPGGPALMKATLLEHGVPEAVVRETVTRYEEEHPGCWIEAARRSVGKMPDRRRIHRDRCVQRLRRRGFSDQEIRELDLDRLLG